MTHSYGYRARTRKCFARDFRQHGRVGLSAYTRPYHIGDYVQIHVNGSIHKGMPHKQYHGRTGVVFNINNRAIGVEINKRLNNRIVKKRINVRLEHVKPSNCRKDFFDRVHRNEEIKKNVRENGAEKVCLKRCPVQPIAAHLIKRPKVTDIAPVRYEGIWQ